MYSKPECGLCDEMMEIVERVARDVPMTIEKVDIRHDPELFERHKNEIPVLEIEGRRAFKARLTEAELRKKLAKAAERAGRGDASEPEPAVARVEALEALEPPPWRPPAPMALLILVATLAGFGWYLSAGLAEAAAGRRNLAAKLLKVEPRDETPPQFQLTDLAGKKVSIADFPGKVVLLNFWATWCPPCVEEMPSILRLQRDLAKHDDFVMLLVSADDGWEPVRTFFGEEPPTAPVLLDEKGAIAKQYGTTMFPETYVLVDGRIVGFIEGPRDWDAWFARAYFQSFLGG